MLSFSFIVSLEKNHFFFMGSDPAVFLIAASKRSVSWEHEGSSFWMSCSFLLIRLDFCLAGNMGSRYMTSTGSRSAGINSTLLPSVSFIRAAISFNTGCFFARRRASFFLYGVIISLSRVEFCFISEIFSQHIIHDKCSKDISGCFYRTLRATSVSFLILHSVFYRI